LRGREEEIFKMIRIFLLKNYEKEMNNLGFLADLRL